MKIFGKLMIVIPYIIILCLYLHLRSPDNKNELRVEHNILPTHCPNDGKDLKIIILIKSAPKNVRRRRSIRETWANVQSLPKSVKVYFVLGIRQKLLDSIMKESETYGDIILGFFIDISYNLTFKGFHIFSWLNFFCRKVPYVLYIADDMYVNVTSLLTFLDQCGHTRNTIFGYVFSNKPPARLKESRHHVTKEEYADSKYPSYTTGSGYVLTGDLIPKIYYAAAMSKFFKIDDIFFTGLLARSLNIRLLHVQEFCILYDRLNEGECIIRSTFNRPSKQYEFHSIK